MNVSKEVISFLTDVSNMSVMELQLLLHSLWNHYYTRQHEPFNQFSEDHFGLMFEAVKTELENRGIRVDVNPEVADPAAVNAAAENPESDEADEAEGDEANEVEDDVEDEDEVEDKDEDEDEVEDKDEDNVEGESETDEEEIEDDDDDDKGKCNFGNKCTNYHCEYKHPEDRPVVCHYCLEDRCFSIHKGTNFIHNFKKPCDYHFFKGGCKNYKCMFRHTLRHSDGVKDSKYIERFEAQKDKATSAHRRGRQPQGIF